MTHTTVDPYAILGVPRDATREQVARAYRRLAKRYHPDLRDDAQASEQMRKVNQAWEILSSPLRRANYDGDALARSSRRAHWSASRPASAPPTRHAASTAWAPPPTTAHYTRWYPGPPPADESPSWPGVVMLVVIGLVGLFAVFAGIVPIPLIGFALLLFARGLLGRDTR